MTNRAVTIAEVLSLGCVAILYLSLTSGTWLISPDSTFYVEGAISLAHGRGFVDAQRLAISIVPPGASLVYAAAALVPANDSVVFNLETKLLAVTFVGLAYLLIRRSSGRVLAAGAALSIALSPILVTESTHVLSDIAFGVALISTLWLYPEEALERLSVRAALGLGILISFCFLLRTLGLALWLGYLCVILGSVGRERWKPAAVVAAPLVAAALLLSLRSSRLGSQYSYLKLILSSVPWVADSGLPTWADWYSRITSNLLALVRGSVTVWWNQPFWSAAGVFIVALMFAGVWAQVVGRRRLLAWLLLFYLGALVISEAEPRYLLPILPLLALLIIDGTTLVVGTMGLSSMTRRVVVALLIVVAIGPVCVSGYAFARDTRVFLDRRGGAPIVHTGHDGFVELARQYTPLLSTSDVVATMHPRILRYFLPSDVRVRTLPIRRDVDAAYRNLREMGATYLFCDKVESLIWTHIEPVISAHASSFQLIADTPTAAIYRMLP